MYVFELSSCVLILQCICLYCPSVCIWIVLLYACINCPFVSADCKSILNSRIKLHRQACCVMAWWFSCVDIPRSIWVLSEVYKWGLLPSWWSGDDIHFFLAWMFVWLWNHVSRIWCLEFLLDPKLQSCLQFWNHGITFISVEHVE